MGKLRTIARRTFLVGSVAVAGGVAFGVWRYRTPYDNPLLAIAEDGESVLTPYIRIDAAGITIITPRAEMGQGVHTTLAALVAEELDVSFDQIRVAHGPASPAYYNSALLEEGIPYPSTDQSGLPERLRDFTHVPAKFLGMQITGGSSTTPDAFTRMRKAGAAARQVLLRAAAEKLDVDVDQLATSDGEVIGPSGRRLTYVELAPDAADIDPPSDPDLKDPADWRLLGKSLPRVDMIGKCTGTATYSIDVQMPDMLYATVRMNPRIGGELKSMNASKAESMPGVRKIIPLAGGVAVVASNTWLAFRAADAIDCQWGDAPYPPTTADHFRAVEAAFDDEFDSRMRDDGDVETALAGKDVIEATYRAPYLAHATMEPLNAVALLTDDRLEVWAGNQNPTQVIKEGATLTGLEESQIRVHTTMMGGGFGRRVEMDFIQHAIEIAKALPGTPVKMTWSREEDMCHDTYRPPAIARMRARVESGKPTALDMAFAAPSVTESQMSRVGMSVPGPDPSIVQAAWDQPYGIPHYRITGYRPPIMLPISYWRSVGASQNGFFHESAIDELAHAAGQDPLQFRLDLLTDNTSRKVLEVAAEISDWGRPMNEGNGRGVAFVLSFGVPVALVVDIQNSNAGIQIQQVFAVVDVGTALDPRNVEAQVQSGINFGLAAAMTGEITVTDGMVDQTNFHNYPSIRFNQAPDIEVRILENGTKIRGIGEPGTPPAAPALANAIFSATGQRYRELPLNKHVTFI